LQGIQGADGAPGVGNQGVQGFTGIQGADGGGGGASSADYTFTGTNFDTTLTKVDPTAARTITLPDTNGTVVTSSSSGLVQVVSAFQEYPQLYLAHSGTSFASDGANIRFIKAGLTSHTTSRLGALSFEGRDSSNFLHQYGVFSHWLHDNTAGAEESEFRFLAFRNGVSNEFLAINREGSNDVRLGSTVNLDMNGNDIIDTPLITSTGALELTSAASSNIILDSAADIRLEPGVGAHIEHIGPTTDHYYSLGGMSGSRTIDLEESNYFAGSLLSTVNLSFINESATSNQVNWFVLTLTKVTSSGISITWPSEVDWPGGTAPPVMGTNETDAYAFFTTNGGTSWLGFHVGDNMV